MLCEAFREYSSDSGFWMTFTFQGRSSERSGRPSTSKTIENVEKNRELIHEDRRRTIHEFADTIGISHGVCQILNRKFYHAPHCSFITTTCPPTHPRNPQSLWLTTKSLSFLILPTNWT
jgi:hypothetical protein